MHEKGTAYDKIKAWINDPNTNATSKAITLTYKEIGELLGISTASVSTNLPIFIAHRFKITVKEYKEKRREYARQNRKSRVKIPKTLEKQLKALRKQDASFVECAAVLKLHYNTIRKYCKLLGC